MHTSNLIKESMISNKGTTMKFVVVAVLVCVFVSGDATQVGCIKREREALLSFKSGLIDDYGVLSSWQSNDCCRWYGVKCSNATGHVVALQLDAHYYDGVLQGKVGSSLLELHHLSYLDLSVNDFGGNPIPEFIGSMKQLQHLFLWGSNFSGSVPPQIGNLTNLRSLDLSYNSLRISENPDWLSTSLSFLSFLDLSQIDLSHTNWMHHILALPSLQELHLETCNLTDAKPPFKHLFANSSSASLSIVDLSNNSLTCSSFNWLSNISTSLVKLDMSYNSLSGPIPNEYFERSLTLIQHLDLSSNMLESEIPKSLCNLSHLRVLVLHDNHFRGHLDEMFGNESISGKGIMESLQILDLAHNRLNGSVPVLRAFSALTEVYLGGNKFTGSMPLSLGQLSMLRVLDLSRNYLEGTISESHFIKLYSLVVLDLSFNSGLNWQVALDWSPPFQLDWIFLEGCNVGPSFPKWIKTQRNFRILDLSSAGITDEAPIWLWSISPVLDHLLLSHNQITGTIPDLSSTVIVGLDLAYNNFSGPIPLLNANMANQHVVLNGNMLSGSISSLCEILHNGLWVLDLSDNDLGGEVPNCWEKMPNLFFLNLANNNFWGEIPPSLGSLHKLTALQLRDNNFSGELPHALRHCQHLQLTDIAGNDLTGEIPAWIGEMYDLRLLNLGRNKFHGSIPPQICNLTRIQILDFSINNLSGKIPDCFHNFTVLAQKSIMLANLSYLGYFYKITYNEDLPNENVQKFYLYSLFQWKGQESEYRENLNLLKLIDLSSNRLSGSIPQSFSSMRGLISLNLSRNSFTGDIIPDIGEMEMLECLDLSHNQLSGKIPATMAQLQFLALLDFSNNNLSGKIPTSTQLQSFTASAYAGNGGLCGLPLAPCPEDSLRPSSEKKNRNDEKDAIFSLMQEVCISMAFGFILGFWGLVASFLLKKSWRIAYFNLLDAAGDWFYVRTAVFLSKWRQTCSIVSM